MPLKFDDVAIAIQSGVSAVCAMCVNYWNAVDNGAPSCGKRCGGPMSGGDFDKYEGPVTDLSQMCFVCSAPPTNLIRAKNRLRVLGCCDSHIDTVKKFKPADGPAAEVIIKAVDGISVVKDTDIVKDRVKLKLS